ncbi:hypothetical protein BC835DRAFT_1520955 [Cytidiella melzeri]|nr:hypothetical protein BC835DRAFT_1520955 [Cytidiella melzeri]
MVRQHRVFAFIIYISDDKARLTRWDRAGGIVSTPIDLKKNPEQLLNFVYRLALMSRAELGEDPTVELATEDEVQKLRDNCYTLFTRWLVPDTETRLDVTDRDTKWISTRRWWQACSTVLSPAIRLYTSYLAQ